MAAKKILKTEPIKLITLNTAMKLSEGYYTHIQSLRNAVCRGTFKRYGPPSQIEINYYEFMRYLGRPFDEHEEK